MVCKKLFILMLVMLVFSVTGCVNSTIRINENDDGSADIQYQVSLSSVAKRLMSDQGANPIEDLKQLAVQQGYTVKDLTLPDAYGYTAEKHITSVADIPNLLYIFGLDRPSNSAPIHINKDLLYHRLQLKTNIDLSGIYGQPGSEEEQLAKKLIKDASFKLMYTTSKPPVNHNCDTVINNGQTKTYVWKIKLGKQNHISFATKTLQTGNIAAMGVLGLIISYCIGMFIYLAKKENQQQAATETEVTYVNSAGA